MPKTTVKILPDSGQNTITFSKNFRIFSVIAPINRVKQLEFFSEDIELSSPADIGFVFREFRYSKNNSDWSLWYKFSPTDISMLEVIPFNPEDPVYIQVKYTYDDGTFSALDEALVVNEIKFRFDTERKSSSFSFSPRVNCSGEKCPAVQFDKDPTFQPYDVEGVVSINKELSFGVNQMFGHQVVYFRTEPDGNSGDYIFKEWTLNKNVERKCMNVLVYKNIFPDNKPIYGDNGFNFEAPFEIHIDDVYFQSIFGRGKKPRRRDFLYFPLVNRMYEIQGCYIHRGIMMEPIYWKIQLDKYAPNIDMLMDPEQREFVDNIILDTDHAFGDEIIDEVKDATMPQQYKTISKRFDPTRMQVHPDLSIKALNYDFNFAKMLENYYDFSRIESGINKYTVFNESPPDKRTQEVVTVQNENDKKDYTVVHAYQDSDIWRTWTNGGLVRGDLNVGTSSNRYISINGPKDTIPDHIGQSDSGRYLQIEAYRDLTFKKQRNVFTAIDPEDGKVKINLKTRSIGVTYNQSAMFNNEDLCNLSFTCAFSVPSGSDRVEFIRAFDYETMKGIHLYATFSKYLGSTEEGDLTIYIELNGDTYTHTVSMFRCDEWYSLIISLSNEFNQQGVFLYSYINDESAPSNYVDFNEEFSAIGTMITAEFNIDQKYHILSSNSKITNLRLFNTMLKQEQHDFILSQLYIKDESMLILIDNCRKQINVPYISRNK